MILWRNPLGEQRERGLPSFGEGKGSKVKANLELKARAAEMGLPKPAETSTPNELSGMSLQPWVLPKCTSWLHQGLLCRNNCNVSIGGVTEMGRDMMEGEVLASEREAAVDTHQSGIGNGWANGLSSH